MRMRWPFAPFEAIAHRGGAWEAPENSLMAFRHAVDLGFQYLETDVRGTADGVAVVFHDPSLGRSTDSDGVIATSSWAQVQAARIHGRQPVLRLSELLEEFPDARFNIDVKEQGAIAPFVATIRSMSAWDRIVVGSFSHDRLSRVRRVAGPRLATSLSPQEVLRFYFAASNRGRRWTPPPAVCVQIPPRFGNRTLVEPRLLALAHAVGWAVHVWTIDSASQMNELLDLGVNGIMTDRPTLLRAVLQQRGMWPSAFLE